MRGFCQNQPLPPLLSGMSPSILERSSRLCAAACRYRAWPWPAPAASSCEATRPRWPRRRRPQRACSRPAPARRASSGSSRPAARCSRPKGLGASTAAWPQTFCRCVHVCVRVCEGENVCVYVRERVRERVRVRVRVCMSECAYVKGVCWVGRGLVSPGKLRCRVLNLV
jgi:hypothetical protein